MKVKNFLSLFFLSVSVLSLSSANADEFKMNWSSFAQFGYESGKAPGDSGLTGAHRSGAGKFGFDRVRTKLKAHQGDVKAVLQLDFAKNDDGANVEIPEVVKDAYMRYKLHDMVSIQTGVFKAPLGMDFLISGNKLDVVKRGMEKNLVFERALGVMLDFTFMEGAGLQIGRFDPPRRSSAVADGDPGRDNLHVFRLYYGQDMFHVEASYGTSGLKDGKGTTTEDKYSVFDVAFKAMLADNKFTIKGEYISGMNVRHTKDRDQNVWYLHAGYKFMDWAEGVLRYYSGKNELKAGGTTTKTDLSNLVIGLNFWPTRDKLNTRIQLNYILVGGDDYKSTPRWGGIGGYDHDTFLAQIQTSF